MNDILQKFSYIVSKMLEEYANITGKSIEDVFNGDNDLSILKIQKLLFFISTCNVNLLDTFTFKALPYGPVNLETYNGYKNIENLIISKRKTSIVRNITFNNIDQEFINNVNIGINDLKTQNSNIFKLKPFNLVDISHKWDCWLEQKDNMGEITLLDILFSLKYYS